MSDNIVISGISGRYPECQNIKEFADALYKGVHLITVDDRRYPVGIMDTPEGMGKIPELGKFDAAYFGIHPKQADYMDPRHRLLLETAYECIVDAGWNPRELRGSKTGVYVGLAAFSNIEVLVEEKTDGYTNIGFSSALAANRISYCFDFKGPSYTVDTACSSSLTAIVSAVKDMKLGLADYAVVCSAQLNLHPFETAESTRLTTMAADCKCKVFSTLRDGYVRAEGVISIFLQREKGSRRIYATVAGAATNIDGYKLQGITYPSSEMQRKLMEDIYTGVENGGLDPNDVVYVEAHGTGTPVGDTQEMCSIESMFCKNRKSPLLVGSVKSNMGHAEVASGLCSISKVVIAMEHGMIPGTLNTEPLDMELPGLKSGKIKVITENFPFEKGIMSLNSFSFGGANAHVALKSNPKEKIKSFKRPKHRLVQVSGRTMEAVNYFLDGIEENKDDNEFLALLDEIHKNNVEGHHFRGYTVLGDKSQREIDRYTPDRPIWFIYTGMGSQWVGMGRDLMRIEVFRNAMTRCAAALKPYKIDLLDIITTDDPKSFNRITNTFCAISAMEIALTDVLYSLGIVPDNMAGHSLGEVGCSYADGQITPEQAVLLAYARGYASENVKLPAGQMAAVGLSKEECLKILPDDIYIACYNAKSNITISGPSDSITRFMETLSSKGIFAKKVNTNGIAYHSKYIKDAVPLVYDFIKKVLETAVPRSSKWVSTSVPENGKYESWTQYNCAEYHTNNFASQVLFDQIYSHISENAIVIEVAPHGLMQAILKRELGPNITNIPLVNRDSDDNERFFLSAIGKIFISGGQPNLRKFYKEVSFPVSRGTKMLSPLVKWDHNITRYVPLWRHKDSFGKKMTVNLSYDNYSYLKGHNIDGRVVMPATGYLELVWQVLADMHKTSINTLPVIMEDVKFKRATLLPATEDVTFLINIMKQSGNFEIFEGGSVICTGKITIPTNVATEFTNPPCPVIPNGDYLLLQREDLYKEYGLRRYMYNGDFRGIKQCDVYGLQGKVEWKGTFTSFLDNMIQLKIMNLERVLNLVISIEKLVIDPIEHLKQVSETQKDLPLFFNPVLNSIKSGAIEIIEIGSSSVPPRQIQDDAVIRTYEFVPYEVSVKDRSHLDTSLDIALQIILQNCPGLIKRPNTCIVSQRDISHLSDKINNILDKQAFSDVKLVEYKNDTYDAIIVDGNSGDDIDIGTLTQQLSENGFILYLGDFRKIDSPNLQILYQAVHSEDGVYLLRPTKEFPASYATVNIRNTDFEWLPKIQELVRNKSKTVLYLFSHGEELSGIVGFVKCLLAEPTELKIRMIFIEDSNDEMFSVDNEFYREQLTKGLTINVLKGDQWGSVVHLPFNPIETKDVKNATLKLLTPGDFSTLKWVEVPSNFTNCYPNSEIVYVFCSSLNVGDGILAARKHQLPQPEISMGSDTPLAIEYAGITADGKRVMGMSPYECLKLQVQSDPVLTWEVPNEWSLEEAATVPCVYATCYYVMMERGHLQPGESVLIHAGGGGIGFAAISIALSMNCIVYTTVRSKEEKEHLQKVFPQLKAQNIGNLTNTFTGMIMQNTNRRGVDLVLSSLSGELFHESLKCVAKRGRFLDIATPIDSKIYLENGSFHRMILDDLFDNSSKIQYRIKDLLDKGIKNGAVKPLPRTIFHENEVENAFKYLSSDKHMGKVLIRLRKEDRSVLVSPARTISAIPKVYFDPKKSYILIGGLGGFGLELADWMIAKGARKIFLNTRRGISNGYQSYCLKKWAQFEGVTVRVNKDDTTTMEGASKLIATAQELGPVGGVFNTALVLRDSLIQNQSKEMYEDVFRPKVYSGLNMDRITRELCPHLDYFVAFSSMGTGKGHPTQTNYAMANSVLENLCEKRKREGLHGLTVQWGPVGDVGYVAETDFSIKDFYQIALQNIYSCLNVLEKFMLQDEAAVGSSIVLIKNDNMANVEAKDTPVETVAVILGIRNIDLVDKSITLTQLGLDSLIVAEIKQTLFRKYQLELNVDEIRDLTFNKLSEIKKDTA